jgi:lysophospholipase L1-like esterase
MSRETEATSGEAGRLARLAQNLALLAAGLVLAALLVEIFLRVFDPFDFRIKGDRIVLPAYARYDIRNAGVEKLDPVILHTKNSLGFRGEEPPDPFDEHLTLVTAGGSTTECFYLSDDQTWTDVLGVKLAGNFRNFWINNAGLDGHSSFGHIVLVEDYLVQLRPNVVLFLVGMNDFAREGLGFFDRKVMRQPTHLRGTANWAAGYSEAVALSLNLVRYVMTLWIGVAHSEVDLDQVPTLDVSDDARLAIRRKHARHHLEPYAQRLETLIRLLRQHAMEPVFVTQPALYGDAVDPTTGVDLATLKVSDVNGQTQWEILEMYNDVTRRVGVRHRVAVIDLARDMPKDSRYYYDFSHTTVDGAERVAEILYAELCPELAARYPRFLTRSCGRASP